MHFNQMANAARSIYVILFSVLTCFVRLNDSASLSELKIACGITYIESQDIENFIVPDNCTSLVLVNGEFPDPKNLIDYLQYLNNKLPIYLILNGTDYNEWTATFSDSNYNSDEIATKYIKTIQQYNLSGIIFNNFYSLDNEIDDDFTANIIQFLTSIKTICGDSTDNSMNQLLLGIVVPNDGSGISYAKLSTLVDFFLFDSTKYYRCTEKLLPTSQPMNIKNTLYTILQYDVDMSKVIMSMDLFVLDPNNPSAVISYEQSCGLCSGSSACIDNLEHIHIKALLIKTYQAAGIYISYANTDDADGSCTCGEYAGVNAIANAFDGGEYGPACVSYGVPGVKSDPDYQCVDICSLNADDDDDTVLAN